jgi:hypothetical protein
LGKILSSDEVIICPVGEGRLPGYVCEPIRRGFRRIVVRYATIRVKF